MNSKAVLQTAGSHVSDFPLEISVACFFIAIGMFVLLIFQQQFRAFYEKWDSRYYPDDETNLMDLLATGNASLLTKLHRTRSTRDLIVRIASKVQGEPLTQLIGAYSYLGFAVDDFRELAKANLVARMHALQRSRTMMLPLPDEAWHVMVNHSDLTFRWASMEYLILSKSKDSLLWLLPFLHAPRNRETGMALHLCCCLAKTSPFIFAVLLDHSSDPFFRRVCLHTLALYPVAGAEDAILQKLSDEPPLDILLVGMKALAGSPSERTKAYLFELVNHRDWNVRSLVAELMQAFDDPAVIQCLSFLAEDLSFPVRLQAVESLSKVSDEGQEELRRIALDEGHPSHFLVQKIGGLDSHSKRAG